MGRLAKLKLKAIKSANEEILEREKRELRARKERDNAKTAQNATKDDLFNIVGVDRAKSKPGLLKILTEDHLLREGEVSGNEVICPDVKGEGASEVEDCRQHPLALNDGSNSGLMEDDIVFVGGTGSEDAYLIRDIKDTKLQDQPLMENAVELYNNTDGNRYYVLYEDFKKDAQTRGRQGSDPAWWIEISQESDWDDIGASKYTNLYLSRGGLRHLHWTLPDNRTSPMNEEMNEALRQMKYLVDYDTSKTREENQSINELHLLDPEGWDDDFKKAQEKRKDGPSYKWNVPPYEKASKEELRKALHAKQRAAVGLDPEEPTFSMPVVDVSGTDRGAAQDKGITFGDSGMDINIDSIEIEDIDRDDYPRFSDAYASYAEWEDGTELTDDELDELTDNQPDLINQLALETLQGE